MISAIPDIFRRIEFRRITRKILRPQSRMPSQKCFHLFAAMDGRPIPQKDQRPPKMFQQIFQKSPHVQPVQIPPVELDKKGQPFPLGRYGQGTDRRNLVLFVEMIDIRRFSLGSPRPRDRRNEQKAAFIEKQQRGANSCGVFLYGANDTASNGRFRLPFSPKPAVRVSGNSTPFPTATARHDWGGIGHQNSSELLALSAARSTGRSDSHKPVAPLATIGPTSLFARATTSMGALEPPWISGPWCPSRDRPGTIERRNSWMLRASERSPRGSWFPFSIIGWRVGAASPILLGFRGVSCPIL